MNVTFLVSDAAYDILKAIAEARGIQVHALSLRFVEQGIGRVCLPCAGMGTNEDATVCGDCKGAGVNSRENNARLRRFQLMVKHIAILAEAPHPLKYERAGGGCVCEKCGLEYVDHPKGSEDFLTLLCDGSQVKL